MAEGWEVRLDNGDEALATIRRKTAVAVRRRLEAQVVPAQDVARRRTEQSGIQSGARPASRRNLSKGRPRYIDSFRFDVIGGPDFPITLEGRNFHPAAHILERGQGAHEIAARDARKLKIPDDPITGGGPFSYPKKVNWRPGSKSGGGYHVLRDVMREMMRIAGHSSR